MLNLVVFLEKMHFIPAVNHRILLRKFELYGITTLGATASQNHFQLDDTMSSETVSETQITCGIPQGSFLGPLFFLLCVNDLPDCLKQALHNYLLM